MDLNHIHRDRDEWMDSYIRLELSDQENDFFESHLLSCADCRKELEQREKVIRSMELFFTEETFGVKKGGATSSKRTPYLLTGMAAAASLLLLIGIFFIPDREQASSPSQAGKEVRALDTPEIPVEDSIGEQNEIKEQIAYLDPYQTLDLFENQINIHVRAGGLKVESPPDSMVCINGSYVEFRYSSAENDSLWLVFFNNLGEFLSEEKIASSHRYQMQFPAGLYYWQLTSEDESLHTAKIYIP